MAPVRVEVVEKVVYMPVPASMTNPVEIPRLERAGDRNPDMFSLGAAYKMRGVRLEQCNGKLLEIRELAEKIVTGEDNG